MPNTAAPSIIAHGPWYAEVGNLINDFINTTNRYFFKRIACFTCKTSFGASFSSVVEKRDLELQMDGRTDGQTHTHDNYNILRLLINIPMLLKKHHNKA